MGPICLRDRRGFAYVEVLLAMVLITILLVPSLEALTAGIRGSTVQTAVRHLLLRSKMEEVLSQPFGDLYDETYKNGGNTTTSVSTIYSDAAGASNRRMVVFYRYSHSSNNRSTNDTGLLFIKVYYEADGAGQNTALHTLAGKWW
jgi:Tfp pilus assembly protein FimT